MLLLRIFQNAANLTNQTWLLSCRRLILVFSHIFGFFLLLSLVLYFSKMAHICIMPVLGAVKAHYFFIHMEWRVGKYLLQILSVDLLFVTVSWFVSFLPTMVANCWFLTEFVKWNFKSRVWGCRFVILWIWKVG